jgi:hypothetical protein
MIFLEKRAHLVLEIPLPVVRLLSVDVTQESANIRGTNGKQSVPALPRKLTNSVLFHPNGRSGLDLGHNPRGYFCSTQPHRKMNVIGNPAHPEAFAIQLARHTGKICMKTSANIIVDKRRTMFRAENDMHQVEAQRLRHCTNYMSGLQPSPVSADTYLGLRPRLVCRQAFGPQFQPQPMTTTQSGTQQDKNPKRNVTNTRSRITPGLQPSENLSAKGATTYQPGPKAQECNGKGHGGLKARHIRISMTRLQPCRITQQKEPGL